MKTMRLRRKKPEPVKIVHIVNLNIYFGRRREVGDPAYEHRYIEIKPTWPYVHSPAPGQILKLEDGYCEITHVIQYNPTLVYLDCRAIWITQGQMKGFEFDVPRPRGYLHDRDLVDLARYEAAA